mmetsp:Transcript_14623/g.46940  ORF Transcript_14623/g.46940 Transcript_14623/m.46940 type:complete len:214 (+) Transcript_14623:178-819(+)
MLGPTLAFAVTGASSKPRIESRPGGSTPRTAKRRACSALPPPLARLQSAAAPRRRSPRRRKPLQRRVAVAELERRRAWLGRPRAAAERRAAAATRAARQRRGSAQRARRGCRASGAETPRAACVPGSRPRRETRPAHPKHSAGLACLRASAGLPPDPPPPAMTQEMREASRMAAAVVAATRHSTAPAPASPPRWATHCRGPQRCARRRADSGP